MLDTGALGLKPMALSIRAAGERKTARRAPEAATGARGRLRVPPTGGAELLSGASRGLGPRSH